MRLSVVIPFYRVEAYIGACLERAGRLKDCELLLVDDCGDDGSADIARAFCAAHDHARIIKREKNGGLSAARNTGLAQARGEYVYFLDSDDLIEPEALMALVKAAQDQRLDVAKARFSYMDDETGARTDGPAMKKTPVMDGGALFAAQCRENLYEPMVWQCLYRRAFLQEIGLQMAEGLLFEDELFQAPALLKARRAAAFEEVILLYRQRAGSIMGSFAKSSQWCLSYLEVCRRLSALTEEAGNAKKALSRRIGQIALSVAKNVKGYDLPEDVAEEVMRFVKENRRELARYALHSGDAFVCLQGLLLKLSPKAFDAWYGWMRR